MSIIVVEVLAFLGSALMSVITQVVLSWSFVTNFYSYIFSLLFTSFYFALICNLSTAIKLHLFGTLPPAPRKPKFIRERGMHNYVLPDESELIEWANDDWETGCVHDSKPLECKLCRLTKLIHSKSYERFNTEFIKLVDSSEDDEDNEWINSVQIHQPAQVSNGDYGDFWNYQLALHDYMSTIKQYKSNLSCLQLIKEKINYYFGVIKDGSVSKINKWKYDWYFSTLDFKEGATFFLKFMAIFSGMILAVTTVAKLITLYRKRKERTYRNEAAMLDMVTRVSQYYYASMALFMPSLVAYFGLSHTQEILMYSVRFVNFWKVVVGGLDFISNISIPFEESFWVRNFTIIFSKIPTWSDNSSEALRVKKVRTASIELARVKNQYYEGEMGLPGDKKEEIESLPSIEGEEKEEVIPEPSKGINIWFIFLFIMLMTILYLTVKHSYEKYFGNTNSKVFPEEKGEKEVKVTAEPKSNVVKKESTAMVWDQDSKTAHIDKGGDDPGKLAKKAEKVKKSSREVIIRPPPKLNTKKNVYAEKLRQYLNTLSEKWKLTPADAEKTAYTVDHFFSGRIDPNDYEMAEASRIFKVAQTYETDFFRMLSNRLHSSGYTDEQVNSELREWKQWLHKQGDYPQSEFTPANVQFVPGFVQESLIRCTKVNCRDPKCKFFHKLSQKLVDPIKSVVSNVKSKKWLHKEANMSTSVILTLPSVSNSTFSLVLANGNHCVYGAKFQDRLIFPGHGLALGKLRIKYNSDKFEDIDARRCLAWELNSSAEQYLISYNPKEAEFKDAKLHPNLKLESVTGAIPDQVYINHPSGSVISGHAYKSTSYDRAICHECSTVSGDCGLPIMNNMGRTIGMHVGTEGPNICNIAVDLRGLNVLEKFVLLSEPQLNKDFQYSL